MKNIFRNRFLWLIILFLILKNPESFFVILGLLIIFTLFKILVLPLFINDLRDIKNIFSNFKTNNKYTKTYNKFSNYFVPMENFKKIYIVYAVIISIIAIIIIDGLVSVPAGHIAVIYDRGEGIKNVSLREGLHLKIPFWQKAIIMDTRIQTNTMSIAKDEGEKYGNDSIESLTKDGQKVYIDVTVRYRISGVNAPWILQNIGLDYNEKIIRPGVRNVIRDIITGYDSTNLYTEETRLKAQKGMITRLQEKFQKNKIDIEDVELRNIQFSSIYLQAIEDKQVAQQRIQKAEYERQEAEKLKEKKIIEAQAEAEAIRLKGETLKANPQVIQFEFIQKLSPSIKWGILPNNSLPLIDIKTLEQ